MLQRFVRILAVLGFVPLFVGACLSSAQPPTQDINAVYTEAAQTVAMQLTLDAGQAAVATLTQAAKVTPTFPPTFTPLPTATPLPTQTPKPPQPTPTPVPCNLAKFEGDVTVKDGTTFSPGTEFIKTWRLRNVGSCTWTTEYDLTFYKGDRMSDQSAWPFVGSVKPGEVVDVSVPLTAPDSPGEYKGDYLLRNSSNALFGIGADGDKTFWVDIVVSSPTTFVYEFADDYCSAYWETSTGPIPCPSTISGTDDDPNAGYLTRIDKPKLENGTTDNEPAIVTIPSGGAGGYIAGTFPPFKVKAGDHFKTVVGCIQDSPACNVTFQLNYSADSGPLKTLGSWPEVYDGKFTRIDIDLSALKGKYVEFILTVLNNGDNTGDWAFWLRPGILR